MSKDSTRSGFVAVVGRPNSGKSSLLNFLAREKIAMVSHKANATRKRLNIIIVHKNAQIIFVDTPGLHHKEKLLNQFMLQEALKAMGDSDLIIFLADVRDSLDEYEKFLELSDKDHILVITKMDMLSNDKGFEQIAQYQKYQDRYKALIPFSITKGFGEYDLLDVISQNLPLSPFFYDSDISTTEQYKDLYKELIRESIFENLSDEIPYESDVVIKKVDENQDIEHIIAQIVVEKESQKGMIIGKGGATIKRVGIVARKKIEELTREQVFLKLSVVVKKGWSKNKKNLEEMGYRI